MTVFDKQPASLTYKIERKDGEGSKPNKKEAALALTVEYTRSDEAIFEKLGDVLEKAVANSPFATLRRLLVPTLMNRVKSYAPAQQLEQAVLLNEFQIPSYEATGWGKIVGSLTSDMRQGLDEWLQEWHSNNQKLVLDESAVATLSRKITLSVEVPTVDVLHTVTLNLDKDDSTKAVTIGRPLSATLAIKHTTRWASADLTTDTPLAFSYTIDAPTDGPWLVAGPKRSRFNYKPDEEETKISLVLVPLKPGMHLLPSVDIQPATTSTSSSDSSGASKLLSPGQNSGPTEEESMQPLVSCETDYHNSGETVLVVREARTTTVTVRERDLMPPLQRIPTATESIVTASYIRQAHRILVTYSHDLCSPSTRPSLRSNFHQLPIANTSNTATMTGGKRTFIVLIIATVTSFVGKLFWDGKYKNPPKEAKKKAKKSRGGRYKPARHENYDPEVCRGSYFDD
ncbi:hypothetical protein KCU84_g14280, partial [Aureobasidium melanogenum]